MRPLGDSGYSNSITLLMYFWPRPELPLGLKRNHQAVTVTMRVLTALDEQTTRRSQNIQKRKTMVRRMKRKNEKNKNKNNTELGICISEWNLDVEQTKQK